MLDNDLEELRRPYGAGAVGGAPVTFARALGIDLTGAHILWEQIGGDLDEVKFGIRWWQGYVDLDRQQRIIIGDYLWQCIQAVQGALIGARLHLYELAHALGDENTMLMRGGDPESPTRWAHPAMTSPADELPRWRAEIHLDGYFRALGTAFDCLAAVMTGVLAIPIDLRRVDHGSLMKRRRKGIRGPTRAAEQLREAVFSEFDAAVAASPHPGWLPWTIDYRNALVHRGRPMSVWSLSISPDDVIFYGPDPRRTVLVSGTPRLLEWPQLSEVEATVAASRRGRHDASLHEDSRLTLACILDHALHVVHRSCFALTLAWGTRRDDPGLAPQPPDQWPAIGVPHQGYSGCARGPASNMMAGQMSLEDGRRWHAAGIFDDGAHVWT